MCEFFQFFINFISSYVRYVHDESMCTGYILKNQSTSTSRNSSHFFWRGHDEKDRIARWVARCVT
jgi:hypothetical protein